MVGKKLFLKQGTQYNDCSLNKTFRYKRTSPPLFMPQSSNFKIQILATMTNLAESARSKHVNF